MHPSSVLVLVAHLARRALHVRAIGARDVDRLDLASLGVGGEAELEGLALGKRLGSTREKTPRHAGVRDVLKENTAARARRMQALYEVLTRKPGA